MLVSFTKKLINRLTAVLPAAFLFGMLCLAGCSESGSGGGKPPLTGPSSFQLTGVDGALQIKFGKVADAQGVLANYNVRYGTTGDFSASSSADMLYGDPESFLVQGQINGLTNGATYYVWINAVFEGIGSSAYHMEEGIPVPTPNAVSNLAAAKGDMLVELTWTAPQYAFTYDVAYSTTDNATAVPSNATVKTTSDPKYMILGLTNNTQYYIWVRASNTNGDSAYTKITAKPEIAAAAPAAPGTLTVEAGNKRLKVTWDAVAGANAYEIYHSTSNTAPATLTSEVEPAGGKVSAMIAGLTNGTPYYVWVKAKNSAGSSSYSAAANGTPQVVSAPIDYSNYSFTLGEATAEYIYAEYMPASAFSQSDRIWDRISRVKETAIGNLYTDAAKWYLKENYPSENVDFVFVNGGIIDNVMKKGTITVGTVMGVTDPDSREFSIVLLSMKGSDVKRLFDNASDVTHSGRGGPSNTKLWAIVPDDVNYTIKYPYLDPTAAPKSYTSEQIEPYMHGVIKPGTLKFRGADFEDNKTYRIATTDNLMNVYYVEWLKLKGTNVRNLNVPYWHAVAEYIYEFGSVTPYIQQGCRIKIEGGIPGGPSGGDCNKYYE